jgi:hypothetical protein
VGWPEKVQVAYGRERRLNLGMKRSVEKCWCSLVCGMILVLSFGLGKVGEWQVEWLLCHSSKLRKKKEVELS